MRDVGGGVRDRRGDREGKGAKAQTNTDQFEKGTEMTDLAAFFDTATLTANLPRPFFSLPPPPHPNRYSLFPIFIFAVLSRSKFYELLRRG